MTTVWTKYIPKRGTSSLNIVAYLETVILVLADPRQLANDEYRRLILHEEETDLDILKTIFSKVSTENLEMNRECAIFDQKSLRT